jgi:chemotaxis protein methyltransferase CheR
MLPDLLNVELTQSQFTNICRMLYETCGITLGPGKEGLVKSRLMKRLRVLGLGSFDEYMKYVDTDQSQRERTTMIDSLTTNKTSFFREIQHFDYLRQHILPELGSKKRQLRFWSAGCSSGEEPYSIAILLREELAEIGRRDVKILATDLSTKVLDMAREGVYDQESLQEIPAPLIRKYFSPAQAKASQEYRVQPILRDMIRFAQLNLMGDWPMKGPFDVIFCRNVMIYFDKPTQQWLVDRFWHLLETGGHLFIGHSESLTGASHKFRYVQPATYAK